jgi:hypothetical protein
MKYDVYFTYKLVPTKEMYQSGSIMSNKIELRNFI